MSYHRYASVLSVNVSVTNMGRYFLSLCVSVVRYGLVLSVSISMVTDMGWHFLSLGWYFLPLGQYFMPLGLSVVVKYNPHCLQLYHQPHQTQHRQHGQTDDGVPPTAPEIGGRHQHQHHLVHCKDQSLDVSLQIILHQLLEFLLFFLYTLFLSFLNTFIGFVAFVELNISFIRINLACQCFHIFVFSTGKQNYPNFT